MIDTKLPIQTLPTINFTIHEVVDDVIFEIFTHLSMLELNVCRFVSQRFCKIASQEPLVMMKVLDEMAFGKEQWETYFGEVKDLPPPPFQVLKELFKTHILVMIPEKVDEEKLDLIRFKEMIELPREGCFSSKIHIWSDVVETMHVESSHWILFPKEKVKLYREPDSSYVLNSKRIIENYSRKKNRNYELPRPLDAVIALISWYVHKEVRLFTDCYTECQSSSVVVGNFQEGGLCVRNKLLEMKNGVAATLKY